MFDKVIQRNSLSNWNIGNIELSGKCSILFVFKVIAKYFQSENFFFYLGPIPMYIIGLKEPLKTRVVVNSLMKKNFMESVVCQMNPLHAEKNITSTVGKQYLDLEKDVFSGDIGVLVKSKTKSFNFGKWESQFEKIRI